MLERFAVPVIPYAFLGELVGCGSLALFRDPELLSWENSRLLSASCPQLVDALTQIDAPMGRFPNGERI